TFVGAVLEPAKAVRLRPDTGEPASCNACHRARGERRRPGAVGPDDHCGEPNGYAAEGWCGGGSASANIEMTPVGSELAVWTSVRCSKPWRRAIARSSGREIALALRFFLTGSPWRIRYTA